MAGQAGAVLVTGCSSGIGLALAGALAGSGWRVYAGVRSDASRDELTRAGCRPLQLDVCDEAQCRAAVARVEEEAGGLDALVNNAGFGLHGPIEEVPLDAARRQFETNFFAVAGLCRAVLPGMRARGQGRILNMSSMGGRITFPGGAYYHASKHALEAFTDSLRFEVRGFGVHVVLVEPGPVRSLFGRTGIETMETGAGDEGYAGFRDSVRRGLASTAEGPGSEGSSTPEEVAAVCIEALRSPEPASRYVVGAMARALIEQRVRDGDAAWDAFLETLYVSPGPEAPDSSGKTSSS